VRWLTARPALQAGLVALLVGAAVQWWAHRADLVLAFWDAQAHLDIARRVWDSTTPGIQMLGTVWLPVPHLLYLPFTLVDSWWWSGLAGGLVGLAAFVATAMATFAIVRRHTEGTAWAWVATLAVILNPSLAYLQTTAMTEPILLAFLTGSVWAIGVWAGDRQDTKNLIAAGILAGLAVGTRYDGWAFTLLASTLILLMSRSLRSTLRFAAPSGLFVALWLLYNMVLYDDPLAFQRSAWSAQAQQEALALRGLLPDRHQIIGAFSTYLGAVGLTSGWILLGAGVIATGFLASTRRKGLLEVLLLGVVLPFNVFTLWGGQSIISVPWHDPPGVTNLRYGVLLLPAAATAIALAGAHIGSHANRRAWTRFAVGVLFLLQGAWFIAGDAGTNGALREALVIQSGEHDIAQMNASRWLAANYDRGRILVAPAVNVSPRTRIPLRDRIYPWTWEIGPAALAAPSMHVDWVLVDRRAATDPVARAIGAIPDFARQFDRVFTERELEIWRRR